MDRSDLPTVFLKPNRERSLLRHHPWVFSGAIDHLTGEPEPGGTVQVKDARGKIVGFGAYSPHSQIRVRIWTFGPETPQIEDILVDRVRRAVIQRKALSPGFHSNAYRIIHSESDWLPGIIADQYGDTVVTQLLTTGAYFWRKSILAVVAEESGCKNLVERSDADVLALEGLNPVVQTYRGEIPEQLWIEEHGLRYLVQPGSGQKTGFYMDQRDNRYKIRQYAAGKRVLDCFSYSGGFAMNALSAGADQVELVDSSEQALENARRNLTENEYPSERYTLTCENAFTYLRKLRDKRASFDLIVLDPPKLAPTHAQVERAARAYKDINLLAMKLLSRGGILFTFSCSGGVGMDLFRKIISDSALDADRDVQVLEQMHQAGDHPISAEFPEGEYLKGLVCIVH